MARAGEEVRCYSIEGIGVNAFHSYLGRKIDPRVMFILCCTNRLSCPGFMRILAESVTCSYCRIVAPPNASTEETMGGFCRHVSYVCMYVCMYLVGGLVTPLLGRCISDRCAII
jgi:hypothetical protein